MAEFLIENRGTYQEPFGYIYHGMARAWFFIEDGMIHLGGPASGYWEHMDAADKEAALLIIAKQFGTKERH